MRRPAAIAAGFAVVAVVAAALYAVLRRDDLAWTLGVAPATPVARLEPGQEVCQRPLTVPVGGTFDRVEVKASAPVRVTVRDLGSGRVLAAGRAVDGRPAATRPVAAGTRIAVCVAGDRPVAVYGSSELAARTSTAAVDGRAIPFDLALTFRRPPRSPASLAPDIATRAALFKSGWVGPWTLWVLAVLVVAAVPALLVRAVRTAEE